MEVPGKQAAWLVGFLSALLHLSAAQQCYICGPTEERRRCQPTKLMDVPANITIDDSMCTVIESTAYHIDVLCEEYPAPKGYYFECVDKSNSQFSCRSTCGPSLESIGTGPEFDLLNSGGGGGNNLLLGKKNKGSLFDFSDFKNGGALDFKFGGVQQGIYNPNNPAGPGNATQTGKGQNNGTFATSSASSKTKAGGFSSDAGNGNIFDKDLFGNNGLKNNVFTNSKADTAPQNFGNSNINKNNINNLKGVVNSGLNNNNKNNQPNLFQFQNPFSANGNLNPNQPNSFRDPFSQTNRKPTPKLNTPKGNPFGNAPAFGQAPFGPNAFGNPPPLSGGKTGLGFIDPKQPSAVNLKFDRPKQGGTGNEGTAKQTNIDLTGLGPSEAIDLSKRAPESKSIDPQPQAQPDIQQTGYLYPNDLKNNPLQDRGNENVRSSVEPNGVGGVGKQDPSALTFDVKPVVTNYPTNQDDNFDPRQANSLYPLNDKRGALENSYGGKPDEFRPDQVGPGASNSRNKFDTDTDYSGGRRDARNNPPEYVPDYSSDGTPRGTVGNYQNYGKEPKERLNSKPGAPPQYNPRNEVPEGQNDGRGIGAAAGSRDAYPTDSLAYQNKEYPPNVGDYPGSSGQVTPSSGYDYNNPGYTYNNNNNNNDNNNNYFREDNNKNIEPAKENPYNTGGYPGGKFQNANGYGKPPASNIRRATEDDDLRSNEIRDAIGPEGLKTKGVVAPDGLDGSRLRSKDPVGQGADFVGTSLLADGDYLDRSSPGRAASKQVPEEFEKPFDAQSTLFPGFDKFASGEGNSDFGTKGSVFNMFGDRNKSPPGFRDGNFNFNNPDFLKPDTYGSSKEPSGDSNTNSNPSGRKEPSGESSRNNYAPSGNSYDNRNNEGRTGDNGSGSLKDRLRNTPSSQPIFQAADRLLGKSEDANAGGGNNNNNFNNNGDNRLARNEAPYTPYGPPGNSAQPYRSQGQSQQPGYYGGVPSAGNAPYQPPSYTDPSLPSPQGYNYANGPEPQNLSPGNPQPYGNPQQPVSQYGGAISPQPYNQVPQKYTPPGSLTPAQPGAYGPYRNQPGKSGAGFNPYLSGQQPAPNRQGGVSPYQLPPGPKSYYGNPQPRAISNPYLAQPSETVNRPYTGSQPAQYPLYPGGRQPNPGLPSPAYNTLSPAATPAINQNYPGPASSPSGNYPAPGYSNPSYQTQNGYPTNANGYSPANQPASAPDYGSVNFRPLGPTQPSGRKPDVPSNPYLGGGGGGGGYVPSGAQKSTNQPSRDGLSGSTQGQGLYTNPRSSIPSTVPAFTNIFGDLTSAANSPGSQATPQNTRQQSQIRDSSPFSFLTQELPNAAEKTAAFDLDNRRAFENNRQRFDGDIFGGQRNENNNLGPPTSGRSIPPTRPGGDRFRDNGFGGPPPYPGRVEGDGDSRDYFPGQGAARSPGVDGGRGGFAPPLPNSFNRVDGAGAAGLGRGQPDFIQPAPGLGNDGRGYDGRAGADGYGNERLDGPGLYGGSNDGFDGRGGPTPPFDRQDSLFVREASPFEQGQPSRSSGGFDARPGNRFANPYQDEPSNQRYDSRPRDAPVSNTAPSSDPFNRNDGFGFENKFGSLDGDGFQNRFSNDRFSDPAGYFGDGQFTDDTTREDTKTSSTQSDQSYDDDGPSRREPQYYADYQ